MISRGLYLTNRGTWRSSAESAQAGLFSAEMLSGLFMRPRPRCALQREGGEKRGDDKWVQTTYLGWVRLRKCLGGEVVALHGGRNVAAGSRRRRK